MKSLVFLVMAIFCTSSLAASFDGVLMTCLEVAEKRMSKHKRMSIVSVCRERKNPNKEHYTFSDGSSVTGFTTDTEQGCTIKDWWNGQDDQDSIDPIEWKKECLVEEDFITREVKTTLKAEKDDHFETIIPNATIYSYSNSVEMRKDIEFAEAVGKNIRREYYQNGYKVESYSYQEIDFDSMIDLLETSEGEFKKLSEDEVAEVYSWYEDKRVVKIYMMRLQTEYHSGTGLEQVFILIPEVKYESTMAISRFYYSE